MTKEEKASEWCHKRKLSFVDPSYDAFIDGVNYAEQESDKIMIAFAKWYHKIQFDSSTQHLNLSDRELISLFKDKERDNKLNKQ